MNQTVYPYSNLVTNENTEVIKQEIITYLVRDGKVLKNVVMRSFFDNDYVDTQTTETLYVIR